jgi:hypothetical protein
MTPGTPIRPSLWHVLLGVPFLAAGGCAAVYFFVSGVSQVENSLTQVLVPGKANLTLATGKSYTVYLEDNSVFNGKIYSAGRTVGGLSCLVKSSSGKPVPIARASMTETYQLNARTGHSVLQFSVPHNGSYEFSCAYDENESGPQAVMAVGSGAVSGLLLVFAKSFAAIALGGGTFILTFIIVTVKRSREAKRLGQRLPFGV